MESVAMLIVIATKLLLVGITAFVTPKVEKRCQAHLETVANRLQMVDILILCAIWDGSSPTASASRSSSASGKP
jgi:hypothetical protein